MPVFESIPHVVKAVVFDGTKESAEQIVSELSLEDQDVHLIFPVGAYPKSAPKIPRLRISSGQVAYKDQFVVFDGVSYSVMNEKEFFESYRLQTGHSVGTKEKG